MEDISISIKDLKNIVEESKVLGEGYFGIVIEYNNRLIKLDKNIYQILKMKNLFYCKRELENYYKYNSDFENKKQIEYLSSISSRIKYTKLPEGVISIKDISKNVVSGTILPYHKNYEKLENFPLYDYKKLLIILKKILLAAKELEENRISQEDFASYGDNSDIYQRDYNVLYKDDTPQIIDMSGFFVKTNDLYISPDNMYRSLSNILLDYYYFYHIKSPFVREKVTTYDENEYLIQKLEKELKKNY